MYFCDTYTTYVDGDTIRDEGIPEKAIDQYEKAWDHTQNAIKVELENDDDD